nr:MAG TPA: hypothetical protein [Caudoviricetes sp.]
MLPIDTICKYGKLATYNRECILVIGWVIIMILMIVTH